MTWLPNVVGRPIELVHPVPDEVDFPAMAHALARINRSSGHPRVPVSVALHTLVGLDLAPDRLKPWWLLHDGHEERTGDHTTPAKEALEAVADELFADFDGARIVREVRRELEARHDAAIHKAAGLPLPDEDQRAAIRAVDLATLATERRDFYAPCSRRWHALVEAAVPSRRVWRFQSPDKVADALLLAFRTWLPALRRAAV